MTSRFHTRRITLTNIGKQTVTRPSGQTEKLQTRFINVVTELQHIPLHNQSKVLIRPLEFQAYRVRDFTPPTPNSSELPWLPITQISIVNILHNPVSNISLGSGGFFFLLPPPVSTFSYVSTYIWNENTVAVQIKNFSSEWEVTFTDQNDDDISTLDQFDYSLECEVSWPTG